MLPSQTTSILFDSQLKFYGTPAEIVGDKMPFFLYITQHNIKIILLTFLLSLVYGAGSVIILTWNASVWGTVMGFIMRQGLEISENPFMFLVVTFGTILPFLLLESVAYISAAIAGGVIAKTTIQEKFFSKRFKFLLTDSLFLLTAAIIIVLIAGFIELLLI